MLNPRTAAAHVFVSSVDEPVLEAADRHHLERVLRLRAGAEITVGDGRGRWRPAVLGAELQPLGSVVSEAAARPPLTVGFAVVKGDRPDLVVRALTEVGIDRIVPLHSARSVVRWTGDRRLTRRWSGSGASCAAPACRAAGCGCRRSPTSRTSAT